MISDIAEAPTVSRSESGRLIKLLGNFAAKDFALIPNDNSIECLDAYQGEHLDADDFKTIADRPFKRLNLSESDIDDRVARTISTMKQVKRVILKGTNITDKGLIEIATLPLIDEINVDRCEVSDKGIAALSQCKRMRRLSINSISRLSFTGLNALRSLPLDELLCSNNQLTDDELREIAKMRAFSLYISDCGINDDNAQLLLSKTSRIRSLNVTQNAIGLKGLAILLRLPVIETITLTKTSNLTPESVDKLQVSLHSNCKILLSSKGPQVPDKIKPLLNEID